MTKRKRAGLSGARSRSVRSSYRLCDMFCVITSELELELILSQMAQKPVLRVKWVCVCNAHEARRKRGGAGANAKVQSA